MPMWDALPEDVRRLILAWRARLMVRAIVQIQSHWRTHRVRALLKRFVALRYLQTFREWNPSASIFLRRTRL